MREYLEQVQAVSESGLYFLTVEAALVIPDMCAGLAAADGKTSGALYQGWFDRFVAPRYMIGGECSFSGEDCYGLRCAMLHQGRLEPHKGRYERIVFLEPHGNVTMHNNIINDVLNIDVTQFSKDMVEGAETWLSEAEETPQ